MFINFWYAACQSADVPLGIERPLKVEILGHRFALWRTSSGAVKCVSDTCSHRGGALGNGRIRGECLECPYHGWTFDGDGSCVQIPSLGRDAKIPTRARVDAYPVEERYGLVHVFLGDLPEAQRTPIIGIPEFDEPTWRFITLKMEWRIDYKRAVENTLDPAHNEFTHPSHGFLGLRDDYRVEEFELMDTAFGTGYLRAMCGRPMSQLAMGEAADRASDDQVVAGAGNHGPHCTWTSIHASDEAWMHGYAFHTPLHETLDRIYLLFGRNYLLDAHYDATLEQRALHVAEQNQEVLEPVRPQLTPRTTNHEFYMPADKAVARYREYCREWEERGWRIDVRRMRGEYVRTAFAIPSPARRIGKGWVLPTVPLIAVTERAALRAAAG